MMTIRSGGRRHRYEASRRHEAVAHQEDHGVAGFLRGAGTVQWQLLPERRFKGMNFSHFQFQVVYMGFILSEPRQKRCVAIS
jgi:hypothetical protein